MFMVGDRHALLQVAEAPQWFWKEIEKDMLNWWLFQSEGHNNLKTRDNERIIVIRVGELNDGPGPDILNCHLFLNDLELTGSVEMHRQPEDWFHHGHDLDPAYQDVILHVVGVSGAGPDMATLVLDQHEMTRNFCPARRPISSSELEHLALIRFEEKAAHIRILADNTGAYSPLLLGMIEILCAGPRRAQLLTEAALGLGLDFWPQIREWRGSRQSFPAHQFPDRFLDKLLGQSALFQAAARASDHLLSRRVREQTLAGLRSLGISRNQACEWLVNVLAPFHRELGGFGLWLTLSPFRSYGQQTRMCIDMGITSIRSVAEQQGLLAWNAQFCSKNACSGCPLTHT